MIKINLMTHHPRTPHRKYINSRMQLAIGIGVVCLTVAICWVWGTSLLHQRDRLRHESISQEQRLAAIDVENQERQKRKAKQHLLMAHAHVLSGYQDKKFVSILTLDEVSKSLEPLEIWLSALSITHHDVAIEGNALAPEDIEHFIGNLEESLIFGELIRMKTQPHLIEGDVIQQFTLQFTIQS